MDVFVVEQACAYPEVDGQDLIALHLFYEENGQIQAYARIVPTKNAVRFGRVLVVEAARRCGFGRELVRRILDTVRQRWPKLPIRIQAQDYLKDFYAGFGFRAVSDVYLEDGIPHIDMEKAGEM